MNDTVVVTQAGSTWTFTLNRPDKRNALNAAMVEALLDGVHRAHQQGADVLVLRGEGKSFCAGFDFAGVDDASEADLLWRFVRIEQLLQALHRSPCLTLGLAQGANFGAGVDLLVACKRRVAEPAASFRMPGLKFGLVLGTRRLAACIGAANARETQSVAATLTAETAHRLGLLTDTLEPAQWSRLIEQAQADACSLPPSAREDLYRVLQDDTLDADLADLVRSVMRPGLKDRIAKYRAGG